MRNTKLISLAFGLLDLLVIAYYWLRCSATQSAFYCDAFMFGGILYFLGFPALLLLCIAVLSWLGEKKFPRLQLGLLVAAGIIFLAPWVVVLAGILANPDRPVTYYEWRQERQEGIYERENLLRLQCAEYDEYMRTWKEGEPLRTPPPNCGVEANY